MLKHFIYLSSDKSTTSFLCSLYYKYSLKSSSFFCILSFLVKATSIDQTFYSAMHYLAAVWLDSRHDFNKNNEWREIYQYFERTNVKIIVESKDKTSMHKWIHEAIVECIEENHWDFHFLSEITWNDQSKVNEEVYKDHQEHATNEKRLLNHWWLSKVYSSMW